MKTISIKIVFILAIIVIVNSNLSSQTDYFRLMDPSNYLYLWGKTASAGPPFIHYTSRDQEYHKVNSQYYNHASAVGNSFYSWAQAGYVNFSSTSSSGLALDTFYSAALGQRDIRNPGLGWPSINGNYEIQTSNSYIKLNTFYYWTDGQQNLQNSIFDVQAILTHEIGHIMGLAHPYPGTYYPTYQVPTMVGGDIAYFDNTLEGRSLEQSDIDACQFLQTYVPDVCPTIGQALTIVNRLGFGYIYITQNLNISQDITISSGVKLQINPGVILTFDPGKSLILNGTITANNVTFQGSGWNGIIANSTSSSSITNCTITGANNGIYFTNTAFQFQGNTLTNNSTGILFSNTGGSGGLVRDNRIYSNTTGISCTGDSYPLIFPFNKIANNGTNISISPYSAPDFGRYADQGHNSIYLGNPWDINSGYPGTIYAEYSWWGSYPPGPGIYGTVSYYNTALNYDPNPLFVNIPNRETAPVILKKMSGTGNSQKTDIPGLKETDDARGLFSQGKYADALNAFETILNNYSDYLSGEISLFFIDECLNILNRESDKAQIFDDIVKNKGKKDISGTAQMIRTKNLIQTGKYNEAINNAISLKADFPNSRFEKYSLYDLGTLYWYFLKDTKSGEQYYRQLIKLYPGDPLSESALAALGEWKPKGKDNNQPFAKINIKSGDVLGQNYPNPFNPSTMIDYQLPIDGHVTLKVYDILGKEVSTLINEYKPAGNYSAYFNANKLASGTYYYRLVITPSDGSKNMIIQKAMQILK